MVVFFWIAKNKEGQKDIFLARGGGTYCSSFKLYVASEKG